MKLLNIDWPLFFDGLKLYRQLPEQARRVFVEQVKPSQAISKKLLAPWWKDFSDAGLMVLTPTEVNISVKPEYREFSRVMRAMSRSYIFESPSRESFLNYIYDHLTSSEMAATGGSYLYGRLGQGDVEKLYTTVCSAAWVRQFLSAKGTEWERDYADPATPRYFTSFELVNATQQLVRAVVAAGAPVHLERVEELCPDLSPAMVAAALRAALRYLLLFPALSGGALEPIIGLWPGVAEKLSNKPLPPPQPVVVSERFRSPYLMDDMIALVSACAAEPLRLRSSDMQVFEADRKKLAEGLGSLPEWMERAFHTTTELRIARALEFLIHFQFVDRTGRPGSEFRLIATEEGTRWMMLGPKERMRVLLDGLRDSLIPMLPGISLFGVRSEGKSLLPAALSAYGDLPADRFFRLSDFLPYQARTVNPINAIVATNRHFSMQIGGAYISAPSEEESEQVWQNLLFGFLNLRLLPLGGVQMGIEDGGNAISFSLTDVGRYMAGSAKDFEMPADPAAHILVQPNFDVVFLAPSARLEAELGRFSERKGRHIGTLFRITKSSVFSAAAAGMTLDQVLAVLRENCPAGVPVNVESEISGWFRRFRPVTVRPATIMRCPDEETAAMVVALLGKKVSPITATVLEMHEAKVPPNVAKKLRDLGIFLKTSG